MDCFPSSISSNKNTALSSVGARQPARPSPSSHNGAPADVTASPCGLYATEMLCGSYGVSHSINLFIVDMFGLPSRVADFHFVTDCCLWILYADQQGCIQSEGFNFIKDLPTFFRVAFSPAAFGPLRMKLEPYFGRTSAARTQTERVGDPT
jgi:hypothetical protein